MRHDSVNISTQQRGVLQVFVARNEFWCYLGVNPFNPYSVSDYSEEPIVVPFYYPSNIKKKIHASLSRTITEETLESSLNKLYGSYSKRYVLNRGNPTLVLPKYTMDLVLPRPELDTPRKKYTLKSKK